MLSFLPKSSRKMRPWHGSFIFVTDDRRQEIIRVRIGREHCCAHGITSLLGEANVPHLRISRSLKPEQLP
jgi:hypothetical protein